MIELLQFGRLRWWAATSKFTFWKICCLLVSQCMVHWRCNWKIRSKQECLYQVHEAKSFGFDMTTRSSKLVLGIISRYCIMYIDHNCSFRLQGHSERNYIMLAGTEYDNILGLFAAKQNSWFMTQHEVGHIAYYSAKWSGTQKVGYIAYYSANCSSIKHYL